MFEAMKRCGKDCTNAELAKTQNFDTGVMTPVSFTATQHLLGAEALPDEVGSGKGELHIGRVREPLRPSRP